MYYYDEVKNDILEVLEEDENTRDILLSGDCKDTIIEDLTDYLWDCDCVTGNGSGSYYFNSLKARKQCYDFSCDVIEALEMYGYEGKLELFKVFESLANEGYINVNTMEINEDAFCEDEMAYRWCAENDLESVKELDFEVLDVITRCYFLNEAVVDIIEEFLK